MIRKIVRAFMTKRKKEAFALGSVAGTPLSSAPGTPTAAAAAATLRLPASSPLAAPLITTAELPVAGPSERKRKAESPVDSSQARKKIPPALASSPVPTTLPALRTPPAPRTPPQAPAVPSPSTLAKRTRSATLAAGRRDGNVCILSGYPYPDGAHIFPFSVTKDQVATNITFDLLGIFWGATTTKTWEDQCRNLSIIESAKNILSLGKHLHAAWGATRFGLKPLYVEDGAVLVQFHWLHQGLAQLDAVFDAAHTDELVAKMIGPEANGFAVSCVDDGKQRGTHGTIAHRLSGLRIETGQVFAIGAEKPEDLPSMELLQLQWDLVRVAAMSGAADVYDDEDKGDDGAMDDGMGTLLGNEDVDPL